MLDVPSDVRCFSEVQGPGIDTGVLDLLRRQLDRCGPSNLTCPACPVCPSPSSEFSLFLFVSPAFLAFALGALVGQRLGESTPTGSSAARLPRGARAGFAPGLDLAIAGDAWNPEASVNVSTSVLARAATPHG